VQRAVAVRAASQPSSIIENEAKPHPVLHVNNPPSGGVRLSTASIQPGTADTATTTTAKPTNSSGATGATGSAQLKAGNEP